MSQRFVMWGRKHSVNRVVTPGSWVGLASPTPVMVPFPGAVSVAGVAGGGSSGEPVRNGLGHDLEVAAVTKPEHRPRGRPKGSGK